MSDVYSFPPETEPQHPVIVNVNQPEAASSQPNIPAASLQQVRDFIASGKSSLTPAGTSAPHSVGRQTLEGLGQGLAQDVLGVASLVPGTGTMFTREGKLGQWAYQPATGPQKIAQEVGSFAPLLFPAGDLAAGVGAIGRAATLSPAALGRIWDLSPTLARTVGRFFSRAPVRTAGGQMLPRALSPGPAAVRGAVAGGLVGAAQEPEGDPSYTGRVGGAFTGAATGALLGGAGGAVARALRGIPSGALPQLSANQNIALSNLIAALGGGIAGGTIGYPWAGVVAGMALHNMGFGVRQVHAITPGIIRAAIWHAANLGRAVPVAAGVAARTANETGP